MTRIDEVSAVSPAVATDTAAELAVARGRVSTATIAHTIVLIVVFGVLALSSSLFHRYSLNAIGGQMAWFSIAGVSLSTFAAALCIARWSSPATRLLGFSLTAFTLYQFGTIANYAPTHRQFVLASALAWPAIPLCFALWTRTALYIVAATPSDDAPSRGLSSVLVAGWQRLQGQRGGRFRRSPSLSLEVLTVWVPAGAFIVLGLIPGVLYSYDGRSDAWRGWQIEPHLGLVLMCSWGFLIALTNSALLFASWGRRALHLLPGVHERARWAPRATAGLTFFLVFEYASVLGLWPESILDLCIAVCAVPYALLAIDADSYRDTSETYSPFLQRLLAAALWCGMTLAIVAAIRYHSNPIAQALFAALVAAALPVGLFLSRTLVATEPTPTEPTTSIGSGEEVAAALCAPLTTPVGSYLSLDVLEKTYGMLKEIDGHDLKMLIGGLPGPSGRMRNELRDPRADARLRVFVRDFPALDCSHAWEVRLMRLNKLIFQTARPRIGYDIRGTKDDPSRWRALAAYCLLRLDPSDPLIGPREREERLRLRVWLKGERAHLCFYGDLDQMDDQALRAAFRDLGGEESAQRRKKALDRALDMTLRQVIAHWQARAEHALGERMPAEADKTVLN